jgi:toxin-antitoxin system PIN domain toxin
MISVDTSILLPAVVASAQEHARAAAFLESLQERDDVALSELVLLELYLLLRNPVVMGSALAAGRAAATCEAFRQHPRWQLLGLPDGSRAFHDALWPRLRKESFARRRAIDCRMGLALRLQGVTSFATVNRKDFQDLGFARVWNPLEGP